MNLRFIVAQLLETIMLPSNGPRAGYHTDHGHCNTASVKAQA